MNEVYTDLENEGKPYPLESYSMIIEDYSKDTPVGIKDPTKLLKLSSYKDIARMKREQIEKEDPRYFAPEPEDIHIGYECELRVFYLDIPPRWVAHKLKSTIFNPLNIRVPYLTKEQIEAEGWKFKGKSVDLWWEKEGSFDIGSWTSYKIVIHYGMKGHIGNQDCRLYIYAEDQGTEHHLFEGECKDINTFRYICKLINI